MFDVYKEIDMMQKIHTQDRVSGVGKSEQHQPKSSWRSRSPKVAIALLLVPCNEYSCQCLRSVTDSGTMLTSTPLSTRKRSPLVRSMRKRRRLTFGPGEPVVISCGPRCFSAAGVSMVLFTDERGTEGHVVPTPIWCVHGR